MKSYDSNKPCKTKIIRLRLRLLASTIHRHRRSSGEESRVRRRSGTRLTNRARAFAQSPQASRGARYPAGLHTLSLPRVGVVVCARTYHFTYFVVLQDLTLDCHISSTSCQILSKLSALCKYAYFLAENGIAFHYRLVFAVFLF